MVSLLLLFAESGNCDANGLKRKSIVVNRQVAESDSLLFLVLARRGVEKEQDWIGIEDSVISNIRLHYYFL